MSRRRSPSDYQPGETVRHFEILGPLGSGGMGVVYLARDRKLERDVALKFLPTGAAGTDEESKRFLREARVASALDHPNICTVHAIDESADGRVFIAMAAYDGETLRQRIARGRLGLDEWLDVALQIARGLQAAHSIDIVHRDIKPANVMITSGGLVKILDFGLSKIASSGDAMSRITQHGTILGSLGYIPPEQVRGESVGPASDIWSFGAVLYEMATGRLPFDTTTEVSSLYSILHDEPEPPRRLVPAMSQRQEAIILRALAKDLQDRYRSIEEVADDLRELARDEASFSHLDSGASFDRRDSGEQRRGSGASKRPAPEPTATMVDAAAQRELAALAEPTGARPDTPSVEHRPTVVLRSGEEDSGSAEDERRATTSGEWSVRSVSAETPEVGGERRSTGRRIWSVLAALLVLSLVVGLGGRLIDRSGDRAPQRAEVRAALVEAREHVRRLDGAAAIGVLAPVASGDAVSSDVHLALAEAYELVGREDEAIARADAAIAAAEGSSAESRALYLGYRAHLRGLYVDAEAHLERYWAHREASGAWDEDGLRLDRGLLLARLRARNGRHDRAFELITDLHRSSPADLRLPLLEAAIAPDASDRLAAARQAIGSLQPADGPHFEARARWLEGRALRRLGESGEATAALEPAFEIFDSIGHDIGQADVATVLGNLAWDRNDLPAARAHYEQAARLYGSAGNSRRRARLLTNMALVLRELGDLEAATTILQQALELQRALGDRVGQVFTLINLAGPLQLGGRLSEAIEVIDEATTLVQAVDDMDARMLALEAAGELHTLVGQLQRAADELETMRGLAEQAGDFLTLARAESRLGRVRFLEGDLDAARRHFETALDRFAVAGAPLPSSATLDAFGQTLLWIGDLESCRQVLEKARRYEQSAGVYGRASLQLSFAELLLFEGRIAEAVETARQTLDEISPGRDVFLAVRAHEILARVLLAAAALDEAQASIDHARQLIGDLDVPTHGIPTLHTAARIAVADGRLEDARTLLQEALAKATIHGYRVFGLKARALLGHVEVATGRVGTGRARLDAVLTEAEALGLGRIANQARESLDRDHDAP